jgi:hypothetical protein
VSSILSQHRYIPIRCAIAIVLLLLPSVTTGQNATTHSRWELGGAAGLATVGGDAFVTSASGIAFSTYGAYHVGSGLMLRASAGLSAHGDVLTLVGGQDVGVVATPLADVGFDFLLLSVGPVYRFAPAASLVAPYLGGQLTYIRGISGSNGTGWGGGLVGGMTFWLSNRVGVDSEVTATVVRRRTSSDVGTGRGGWASGHVVTFMLGLVLALR